MERWVQVIGVGEIQPGQGRTVAAADRRLALFNDGGKYFAVDDACEMVRHVYADRVEFHDGEAELAPGFSVHHAGGHTMGHQFARVYTKRGWVVLASDAAHYYANMEQGNPFPAIYSVGENLASFRLARRLAESDRHVIPGHDPLVLQRYPPPSPELEGIVVRLDVEPKE